MDQWILLGIRFSKYDYKSIEAYKKTLSHEFCPHKILVMDDVAKKMLLDEKVPPDKIAVTGQPHFDIVRERYDQAKCTDKVSDTKTIVFASEPKIKDGEAEYLGYSERTIFDHIYAVLRELASEYSIKFRIIIRPHPREDADSWSDVLHNNNHVYLDRKSDSFTLMKSADLICGMSSMFLVEAAICKIPIVSCLIGLKSESPFVFDLIGVYNSCRSRKELYGQLKMVLVDNKAVDIDCDFIENATDKTISYILEDVGSVGTGN